METYDNFGSDDVFDNGLVIYSLDDLLDGADDIDPADYLLPLNRRHRGETEEEAFYNSLVRERE